MDHAAAAGREEARPDSLRLSDEETGMRVLRGQQQAAARLGPHHLEHEPLGPHAGPLSDAKACGASTLVLRISILAHSRPAFFRTRQRKRTCPYYRLEVRFLFPPSTGNRKDDFPKKEGVGSNVTQPKTTRVLDEAEKPLEPAFSKPLRDSLRTPEW